MKRETKRKRKKLAPFIKMMLITVVLLTLVFLGLTFYLNVIPLKFYIPLTIFILLFAFVAVMLLIKRNRKKRITGLLMSLFLSVIFSFGIYYEAKTNDFIAKITSSKTVVENYLVVVSNNSKYKDVKELQDKKVGILDNLEEGYVKALATLDSKVKTENESYDDSHSATDALLSNDVEAIIIEDSQKSILDENYEGFMNNTKVLYTFKIESQEKNIQKGKDITKESFNIYISGIDTYGNINSVSRSDVNIIVTVNPNTHKISLVDIPRDYYVELYNKGAKDKLTHAGIYGVDTSVKSIEKLLGIDINYYVKFNFTSVIKIVDELKGVRVYSDYDFYSGQYDPNTFEIYHYVKGWNSLNGKQALSFARERHSFNDGDRVRGAHQEALIEAILDKVTSPAIIANYTSLLDALSETFITNLDSENLRNFIKMQIDKNIKWEIEKFVINGEDSYEYTYSYPKQKLYVMSPNEESLDEAKEIIKHTFN